MAPPAEFPTAWLEQEDGIQIPLGSTLSIGRSSTCDLQLSDHKISRKHAAIHRQSTDEYWLSDLGSSNGTFLNQTRVSQPVRLRNHDRIRLGPFTLQFVTDSGSDNATHSQVSTQHTIIELKRENRWLLVADIVDSTMLASGLEPDLYRQYVDEWFRKSRSLIADNRGGLNKFLGDGFLATWPDEEDSLDRIATTVNGFQAMKSDISFRFRLALHFGEVLLGGISTSGEESLAGQEVNFVFRMEKVAGIRGIELLLSQPAGDRMADRLRTVQLEPLKVQGFPGQHVFFTLADTVCG